MNWREFDYRLATAVWVATWFACGTPVAAEDAPPEPQAVVQASSDESSADTQQPQPSAEQVAAWIAELDSNRYRIRERATQQLLAAGVVAVESLLAAANDNRPEPSHRAVWILRQLAESPDLDLRRAALEQIVQIKDRPQVVAEAQDALAQIRHDTAVLAIEQLGGRYLRAGDDSQWGQSVAGNCVVLDDQWRGGDEGMAHLTKLRNVPVVIIVGSDVSKKGIAQLAKLETPLDLKLYGTRLKDRDIADLEPLMPTVTIDYRRGAFLGVHGRDGAGAAIVQSVQPGTAAAAAGVRNGDIIRKYNGEPVASFEELTSKIARNVPGDEATLEILRGNKSLEVEVTLGRWQSR